MKTDTRTRKQDLLRELNRTNRQIRATEMEIRQLERRLAQTSSRTRARAA